MKLSVVIPCFNESSGINQLFDDCLRVVNSSNHALAFILVNNGSQDNSKVIFEGLAGNCTNITIVDLPENKGYGGGILAGLELSTAPIVGWTHADLQTPLLDCLKAFQEFEKGAKFVKGKRSGRSSLDSFFSWGMGIFETFLFRSKLVEVNAQPTIFDRKLLKIWKSPPTDFSLDLYALFMAIKFGFEIRRIEVVFLPRRFGESRWNNGFKSRANFIKRTVKYSLDLKRMSDEDL